MNTSGSTSLAANPKSEIVDIIHKILMLTKLAIDYLCYLWLPFFKFCCYYCRTLFLGHPAICFKKQQQSNKTSFSPYSKTGLIYGCGNFKLLIHTHSECMENNIYISKVDYTQCLRSEKKVHFKFEWKFWVKTSWENPQTLF